METLNISFLYGFFWKNKRTAAYLRMCARFYACGYTLLYPYL